MIKFLERHNKLSWAITIIIVLLISYISSLTFPQGSKTGTSPNAIIYHISIFFLFSIFLFISLVKGKNKELISLGIIISFGYAIFDEIHQYFVPNRASAFSDVILDLIGIILASLLYIFILEYRR